MRRRDFIQGIAGSAISWPPAARAQQQEHMRRIGVLMNAVENKPQGQARVAAFRQVLQQLGWSDGGNVRIDIRWGKTTSTANANTQRNWSLSLLTLSWPHHERGCVAAGNPDDSDCVQQCFRSCRCRLR